MARPFTYISSTQYYELEVYYFKLTLFTDSDEYAALLMHYQNKIVQELLWLRSTLDLMRTFRQIPSNERPILAKQIKSDTDEVRIFSFPSAIVASLALNVNRSHLVAVCQKKRPTAGGYTFEYEDEEVATVSKKKGGMIKINHAFIAISLLFFVLL